MGVEKLLVSPGMMFNPGLPFKGVDKLQKPPIALFGNLPFVAPFPPGIIYGKGFYMSKIGLELSFKYNIKYFHIYNWFYNIQAFMFVFIYILFIMFFLTFMFIS